MPEQRKGCCFEAKILTIYLVKHCWVDVPGHVVVLEVDERVGVRRRSSCRGEMRRSLLASRKIKGGGSVVHRLFHVKSVSFLAAGLGDGPAW